MPETVQGSLLVRYHLISQAFHILYAVKVSVALIFIDISKKNRYTYDFPFMEPEVGGETNWTWSVL